MQGSKAVYAKTPLEEASLAFKRFILDETAGFETSPEADLFRVNTLAQMLDRFDDYTANGADTSSAIRYTVREFSDLPGRMRGEGFEEAERIGAKASRWPLLSQDEAAEYLKAANAQAHKRSIGIALCSACCLPLMVMSAISELFVYSDAWSLLGVCGMFGMIALGVYAIVTAKKPENENRIKRKQFSLSARLRKKLNAMRDLAKEKARRRKGRGIALLVGCVVPILFGAVLDELWHTWTNDAFAILGVGGMFAMIGAGVYEVTAAGAEKKAVDKLLKD